MEPTTSVDGDNGLPPQEDIASSFSADNGDSPTRGGGILPNFWSFVSNNWSNEIFTPPEGSVRLDDVKKEYRICNAYTNEIKKIFDEAEHQVRRQNSYPPNLIQGAHLLMALASVEGTDAYEEFERRLERQMVIHRAIEHLKALSPNVYLGDVLKVTLG